MKLQEAFEILLIGTGSDETTAEAAGVREKVAEYISEIDAKLASLENLALVFSAWREEALKGDGGIRARAMQVDHARFLRAYHCIQDARLLTVSSSENPLCQLPNWPG
jgi:hypothetical protein